MPVLGFDTHAYVKKLRDSGMPEAQAEIQLEALVVLLEERTVTREDFEIHKVELRNNFKQLERDIKELEVKLETGLRELDGKVETGLRALEVKLETGLKELDGKIEREIAGVKRDIKELEMRLLLRLGALLVVAIGAIAILVKLL